MNLIVLCHHVSLNIVLWHSKLEPPLSEDEIADVVTVCTSNVYPVTDTVALTVGKAKGEVRNWFV